MLAAACDAGNPASAPSLPPLPEGRPEQLLQMFDEDIRGQLIEELGLEQVLTEEVLAEMDDARDLAAEAAFPGLGAELKAGGTVETSIELTAAVIGEGSAPTHGTGRSMRMVLRSVPSGGDWNGVMIATQFLANLWGEATRSKGLPDGDEGTRTETQGGATTTVAGSYGVEGPELVGDITITTTVTVDRQPYTEVTRVKFRGDACPDADGELTLRLELERSLTGGGPTATRRFVITLTGHVGDDAWLKTVDFDVSGSSSESGSGSLRMGWSGTPSATSWGGIAIGSTQGSPTVDGGEGMTSTQITTLAVSAMLLATPFADGALGKAQDAWRNGGCVVIEVPEGTKHTVGPNETRPFTVHVKQKWEGVDVPVKVTVTEFRGKERIDPQEIDPAPGRFSMTTGPNEFASVSLETVSRRGRDTEDVEYTVAAAYRIVGGLDYFQVDQVVCDVTRTFRLRGGGITMWFHPDLDDPSKGTYEYRGSFAGVTAEGSGTYVIKADATGGTMVGKGRGSITSPLGTFSASGTERYALTPATC